ncbi:hypothetical protein IAT38_000233 [Cryptococcus sp. DSM 104549]
MRLRVVRIVTLHPNTTAKALQTAFQSQERSAGLQGAWVSLAETYGPRVLKVYVFIPSGWNRTEEARLDAWLAGAVKTSFEVVPQEDRCEGRGCEGGGGEGAG